MKYRPAVPPGDDGGRDPNPPADMRNEGLKGFARTNRKPCGCKVPTTQESSTRLPAAAMSLNASPASPVLAQGNPPTRPSSFSLEKQSCEACPKKIRASCTWFITTPWLDKGGFYIQRNLFIDKTGECENGRAKCTRTVFSRVIEWKEFSAKPRKADVFRDTLQIAHKADGCKAEILALGFFVNNGNNPATAALRRMTRLDKSRRFDRDGNRVIGTGKNAVWIGKMDGGLSDQDTPSDYHDAEQHWNRIVDSGWAIPIGRTGRKIQAVWDCCSSGSGCSRTGQDGGKY